MSGGSRANFSTHSCVMRATGTARNDYIDRDYGGRLVAQAKKLLQVA